MVEREFKKLICGVWNNAKINPCFERRRGPWQDSFKLLHLHVLLFSLINILLGLIFIQTEFVPDEGWQSLEVAYRLHFGKGFLTWEWCYGLRSYIYPLFVGLPLYFIDSFSVGFPFAFVTCARLLQSILLLIGEQCYYHYTVQKYGIRTGLVALIIMMTTWFLSFAGPRTLTNSFELALNMIATYFLYEGHTVPFVGIIALNFVVRPTALIYWVAFIPEIYALAFKSWGSLMRTFLVGCGVLLANFMVDSHFYGRPMIPWWNFFMFNFVEGKSAEFGVHPFCWYLYSAIPAILGLNVVLAYLVFLTWPARYVSELRVIFVFIGIYSFVAHKEIRFMLPILPQFCSILGDIWGYLLDTAFSKLHSTRWIVFTTFACTVSAQFAAAIFFMGWHQAGVAPASMTILREAYTMKEPIIWVLMPCYSLPVHTYLHHPNATYVYFTCAPSGFEYDSPNLQIGDFRDINLEEYVRRKINDDLDVSPDFVMLYNYSTQIVLDALRSISSHLNYKICGTYFHTAFPFDSVGREVQLLCRLRPTAPIH